MKVHGKAEISIPFSTPKKAQSVYAALYPETKVRFGPRSKVCIRLKRNRLHLMLLAEDTIALRAIVNSYLRWIASCSDTVNTISRIS